MVVVKANKMWKADVSSIQKLQVITTKKKRILQTYFPHINSS